VVVGTSSEGAEGLLPSGGTTGEGRALTSSPASSAPRGSSDIQTRWRRCHTACCTAHTGHHTRAGACHECRGTSAADIRSSPPAGGGQRAGPGLRQSGATGSKHAGPRASPSKEGGGDTDSVSSLVRLKMVSRNGSVEEVEGQVPARQSTVAAHFQTESHSEAYTPSGTPQALGSKGSSARGILSGPSAGAFPSASDTSAYPDSGVSAGPECRHEAGLVRLITPESGAGRDLAKAVPRHRAGSGTHR